jgi:two-component system catabolic regulation response regulator CreB/two-component system response regulator ChvI
MRALNTLSKTKAKRKILLVDDELDITFSLKLFLEENGYEVDAYNNPSLAIANYKPDLYHLLILDIKMPQIDGFELYKKIQKIDNNVNVFFLTAVSDFSGYEGGKKSLRENHFIQKPIDGQELLKRITV